MTTSGDDSPVDPRPTGAAGEPDDRWCGPLSSLDDYDAFFADYYQATYAWVRNHCPDWDEYTARDIVQDSFAAIFNHLGYIKNARAYLFSTARSKAVDEARARRHMADEPLNENGEDLGPGSPSAEDLVLLRETLDEIREQFVAVQRALLSLPVRQRQAYELRTSHHFSSAEIGMILDCSDNAVDGLVKRARRALNETVGELCLRRYEAAVGRC